VNGEQLAVSRTKDDKRGKVDEKRKEEREKEVGYEKIGNFGVVFNDGNRV
jgi:hypothetical protein